MKELIEVIAEALVDHPEKVEVHEVDGTTTTVFELKVAKADIGQIIGRQGRTAEAIRTIVYSAGKKLKKRVIFDILEF
jgi:predicted RNA-binding protein YlqC (UPF0109 family)